MRRIGDIVADPFQERILDATRAALDARRSGAVLAPTGSGKSVLIAGAAEDALALGRPVLVVQPSVGILKQNLGKLAGGLADGKALSIWAAQEERIDATGLGLLPRGFDGEIVLATQQSFTLAGGELLPELARFAQRGGVLLVDEGQGAAAEKFEALLRHAVEKGAMGILYSATPFRADGQDALEPFGTTLEAGVIADAGYAEVLAAGRIVPPRFVSAEAEFRQAAGAAAVERLSARRDVEMKRHGSIDAASLRALQGWFGASATDAERETGEALVEGVARMRQKHAHGRRLAMIHCDGVQFARAVAQRVGQDVRVGYIDGEEVRLYIGGRRTPLAMRAADQREHVLNLARACKLDALVSCEALGVGTDVPPVDLTIIASLERSAAPLMQIIGRGARACAPKDGPAKADHLVVDLGRSLHALAVDVAAVDAGRPALARRATARLPEPVLRQFREMFAADPRWRAATQDKIAREGALLTQDQRLFHGRAPAAGDVEGRPAAEFIRLAKGVEAAAHVAVGSDGRETRHAALLVDLHELKLGPAEEPRWAVAACSSGATDAQAWLTNDRAQACVFAAAWGAAPSTERRRKLLGKLPSDGQRARLESAARRAAAAAPFLSKARLASVDAYGAEIRAAALEATAPCMAAIRAALLEKNRHAPLEAPRAVTIIVDHAAEMPAAALERLAAHCKEAAIKHVVVFAPDEKGPVMGALAAANAETKTVRCAVEKERPEVIESLLNGLRSGRIVAFGPYGSDPCRKAEERLAAAQAGRGASRTQVREIA